MPERRQRRTNLGFLIILIVCVAALGWATGSRAATAKLNYVALGDSLAAGYAPNGSLGKGYADYLASDIQALGLLGDFDKRYAVPGLTTGDLLTEIQDDTHIDLAGNPDSLGIKKRLSQADVVTLDIGANDLLDTVEFDTPKGTVSLDPSRTAKVLTQVQANVESTLEQIKAIAPKAQVYLMGYFNPFWDLPREDQAVLTSSLTQLNTVLSTAAGSEGVTFVPTEEALAANPQAYLPGSYDIHPNQEGYRVLAGVFWRALQTNLDRNSLPGRQLGQKLGNNGIRIGGQDRFDTARLIAEATYPDQVDAVILATGDNWPDALTGSVLSNKYHAPILLVHNSAEDSTPPMDYIREHLSKTGFVYILGGTSAVGAGFETALTHLGIPSAHIMRLSGSDRTSTALKIDEDLNPPSGGTVFVVTDSSYSDALTVSAYAAAEACPILPVPKDSLPQSVESYLKTLKPAQIIIVGGDGAIGQTVENQLRALAGTVVRYSGADRYATSRALIAALYPDNLSEVCFATGEDYPDALAGSAYAGLLGDPIVLLPGNFDQQAKDFLSKFQGSSYTVFGGVGAVNRQNVVAIEAELEGQG